MQSSRHNCCVLSVLLVCAVLLVIGVLRRTSLLHPTVTEVTAETPPSKSSQTEVDVKQLLERLGRAQVTVENTIDQIWRYWDISNYPLFLATMDVPEHSWNIQKHKFIVKALTAGSDFIVGFSGSSITAGHDSFFNESFPIVFYNDMRSAMADLNISFQVRNHALGNNPCYPYDACIPTHLGDDLDLLTWEQSMNCGHDPKPLESFTRHAVRARKKPVILYMQSGTPFWKPEECKGVTSERGPFTDKELAHLNRSTRTIAFASPLIEEMDFLQPARRKERAILHKHINVAYKTAPIMGQNSLLVESYKCLGPYGADFGEKSGGGGSAWHPGMKGHLARGNMMSLFFLDMLGEALSEATDLLASRSVEHVLALSRNHLIENTMQVLPPPVACDPKVCDADPTCFTEFEPRVSHSLRDIVVGQLSSNWTLDISFFDAKAIVKAQLKQRGYLDKKYVFMSHSVEAPLSLLVKPTKKSSVWLCQLQKGFLQYPNWLGDLNDSAEVFAELSVNPSDTAALASYVPVKDRLTRLELTLAEDFCYRTSVLPAGEHILSIYQRNQSLQVNLAYVLYW